MSTSREAALAAAEADGWVMECESPLELRHQETNSFATNLAAELVLASYVAKPSAEAEKDAPTLIWAKLCQLSNKCSRVMEAEGPWQDKYAIIFSESLSRQVYALFEALNLEFDYYDPDEGYENDVRAFVDALSARIEYLRPLMAQLT